MPMPKKPSPEPLLEPFNPLDTKAPEPQTEQQTPLSSNQMRKADAPFIKPIRSIGPREAFNEKFRKEWEKAWEYVKCTVENYEIIGEMVHLWTKKFPGDPAHEWKVPVNKPVYLPRLVIKQLQDCKYHRIVMEENRITQESNGITYTGALEVTHTKHRINAYPESNEFIVSMRTA